MHRQPNFAAVSHQTVRLSRGRHRSPAMGASVTELASMLAGEPFTDRPTSACPVLVGFLRAYNDAIDDERRQDLYRHAAALVGTRSTARVTRLRSERALQWGLARQVPRRGPLGWFERRAAPAPPEASEPEQAGAFAALHAATARRRDAHEHALAFLDELIVLGDEPASGLPPLFGVADVVAGPARAAHPRTEPLAGPDERGRTRRDSGPSASPRGSAREGARAVLRHGVAHPICAVRAL